MCHTLTITPAASADGVALFAKNSDREPNEAHEIVLLPAMDHAAGSRVRCTYIEIDQALHTFAVALAKPLWIWGAEMGVNEHGVAIDNEAVFTTFAPPAKTSWAATMPPPPGCRPRRRGMHSAHALTIARLRRTLISEVSYGASDHHSRGAGEPVADPG